MLQALKSVALFVLLTIALLIPKVHAQSESLPSGVPSFGTNVRSACEQIDKQIALTLNHHARFKYEGRHQVAQSELDKVKFYEERWVQLGCAHVIYPRQ
jgi:hypothetical protein